MATKLDPLGIEVAQADPLGLEAGASTKLDPLGIETVAPPPRKNIFDSIRPATIPTINLSPYQKADLEGLSSGSGKPSTGLEEGTELTTALYGNLPKAVATGFKVAGNVPLGIGADTMNAVVGQGLPFSTTRKTNLAAGDSGAINVDEPFENTKAALRGDNLPVEETISRLPVAQRLPVGIVTGLTKAAPKIGALALAPATLPAQMVGSGLLFGLDDEGNFSLKEAGLMAALPGVGAASRVAIGKSVATGLKLGIGSLESPAVQKALVIGGDQLAMNAYMLAMERKELAHLKETDPERFWETVGNIMGQNAAFGALHAGKGEAPLMGSDHAFVNESAVKAGLPADFVPRQAYVDPRARSRNVFDRIPSESRADDSRIASPGAQAAAPTPAAAAPLSGTLADIATQEAATKQRIAEVAATKPAPVAADPVQAALDKMRAAGKQDFTPATETTPETQTGTPASDANPIPEASQPVAGVESPKHPVVTGIENLANAANELLAAIKGNQLKPAETGFTAENAKGAEIAETPATESPASNVQKGTEMPAEVGGSPTPESTAPIGTILEPAPGGIKYRKEKSGQWHRLGVDGKPSGKAVSVWQREALEKLAKAPANVEVPGANVGSEVANVEAVKTPAAPAWQPEVGKKVSVTLRKGGKEHFAIVTQVQADGSAQVKVFGEDNFRWLKPGDIAPTRTEQARMDRNAELAETADPAKVKADAAEFDTLLEEYGPQLGWVDAEAYDRNTAMKEQGVINARLRKEGTERAMRKVGKPGQANSLVDRAAAMPALEAHIREQFPESRSIDRRRALEDFNRQDDTAPTSTAQQARRQEDEQALRRITAENARPELQGLRLVDGHAGAGDAPAAAAQLRGQPGRPTVRQVLGGVAGEKTIRELERLHGVRIILVERPDGTYRFNGYKDPKSNIILLNARSPFNKLAIAGHELSHHIERTHPGLYADMVDQLTPLFQNLPAFRAMLEKMGYADRRGNVPEFVVHNELVGDLMGELLTKPEFLDRLAQQEPQLFKRLARTAKAWLEKIIAKFKGEKNTTPSVERYITDLEAAQRIVANALREHATETQMENRQGAESAKGEFSLRKPGQNRSLSDMNRDEHLAKHGELEAFHGSPEGTFETFNESDRGIFFTNKPDLAEGYTYKRGIWRSPSKTPKVYRAKLKMVNPMVIDAGGARNNNIPFPGQEYKRTVFGNLPNNAVSVESAVAKAFAAGHDGVIIQDVMDASDVTDKTRSTIYAVKSPSQIRMATEMGEFSKRPDSGDFFDKVETVDEQKARLERERVQSLKSKAQGQMLDRAGQRLTGKDVDTTGDMFAAPEHAGSRMDTTGQQSLFSKRATVTRTGDTRDMDFDGGYVSGPALFSIRAHHGTPHEVDKFSTDKIGTGEGAQVYGWGLYFAENPEVAKEYASRLAREVFLDGKLIDQGNINTGDRISTYALRAITAAGGSISKAVADLKSGGKQHQMDAAAWIEGSRHRLKIGGKGHEYTVSLDVEPEELLDWDKPLSEQSEQVKQMLHEAGLAHRDAHASQTGSEIYHITASDWTLLPSGGGKGGNSPERNASSALFRAGIKGIRYLDQGSRNTRDKFAVVLNDGTEYGRYINEEVANEVIQERNLRAKVEKREGTYNYVIFDDKHIQITHKNGQPVALPEAAEQQGNLFSKRPEQPEEKNLAAVHNLDADKLRHVLKLGGLPVPSIAIVRADKAVLEGFGDITLVGTPELVTPSRETKVLNADAYSPRYPTTKILIDYNDGKKVIGAFQKYRDEIQTEAGDHRDYRWQASNVLEAITDRGWRELKYNRLARYAYLRDKGLLDAPSGMDIDALGTEVDSRIRGHEDDIPGWAEMKVKNLGVDAEEKIYNGYTYSGRKSYTPHTLENVVKIMKKGFADAEGFNYGVGSIRAASGKQFKNLKGIQADRDMIVPKAQMDALKEEVDKEFGELHDYAMPYRSGGKNSGFGSLNAFSDDLKAMAEGGSSNSQHLREMYPGGEPFDKMRTFLEKLRTLPTEYFEAKPRRAVQLQEFSGAVVPEGTPDSLIKEMERRGLEVVKYKKGDAEARRQAVQQIGEYRKALFSKRSDEYLPGADEAAADAKPERERSAEEVKAAMADAEQQVKELLKGAVNPTLRAGASKKEHQQKLYRATAEYRGLREELLHHPEYVAEQLLAQHAAVTEANALLKPLGMAIHPEDTPNPATLREKLTAEQFQRYLELQQQFEQTYAEVLRMPKKLVSRVVTELEDAGKLPKASPANPNAGRTLDAVTDWLRANNIESPRKTLAERLNLGARAAEAVHGVKTSYQKARLAWQGLWKAAVESYKAPPKDDDFRHVIKSWIYSDQRTGLATHQFVKELVAKVPNADRRKAMSIWLDADGDVNLIKAQAASVPDVYKKVFDLATKLTPDERAFALKIRQDFADKLDDGVTVGLLEKGREDYGVPQRWKVPPQVDRDPAAERRKGSPGRINAKLDPRSPFFSFERTVPNYFEGIMAGGTPENLDIAHLVATYDAAFHKSLSSRGMVAALQEAKAKDGLPVVKLSGSATAAPSGEGKAYFVDSRAWNKSDVAADGRPYRSLDHSALKDWKIAFKDGQGNPIIVKGDMLIHPDHYDYLKNELGQSRLREGMIGKVMNPVFQSQAFLKASKLSGSAFHLMTIGEHMASHLVNPFLNGFKLDLRQPDQNLLVRNGLELGMGYPQRAYEEGLASGHGGIFNKIPVLGDASAKLTDWMFKDYIPAIMMKAGLKALEANRQRYGDKLTPDQVAELTAMQMNAAGGLQNYRLRGADGNFWAKLGADKTLMDLQRLALLAPQFLEARARVVGQALKPYGHEQRKMLILQAGILYAGARILNQLLDGDPHWTDNPFSVVVGKRAYSIRTIVGDFWHLLTDPKSFAAGRLSPISRIGIEGLTGRDLRTGARKEPPIQTEFVPSRVAQNLVVDLANWLTPMPLDGVLPGSTGREQTPASMALSSVGVGSKKFNATMQIRDLAADFNRNSGDPKARDFQLTRDGGAWAASPYRKLDSLLDAGDIERAAREYKELLKDGKTKVQIAGHYDRAIPFTGNKEREAKFKATLTAAQRKVYDEAQAERKARQQAFEQVKK